jgi:DNA mismatch repair protein MLH1
MSDSELPSIKLLPQSVIDRIAAGEVVQRPVSAIKELLENALDAKSTLIHVNIHENANNFTVTDNGVGMSVADLQWATKRHATSKLSSVDNFSTLQSFGFRGEALASIRTVAACLQITTRQENSRVAYMQEYTCAKAEPPRPCARKVGTTIHVQNLFYNMPHRQQQTKSNEEYHRVLRVLQLYAIHVAAKGVGLICSKNKKQVDLNSSCAAVLAVQRALTTEENADNANTIKALGSCATREVIQQVYGSQIVSFLNKFEGQLEAETTSLHLDPNNIAETDCSFEFHGFVTSPSYNLAKRATLILFCNNRLVECPAIKRAIDDVYSEFASAKPFVYLALEIPPEQVDVNVHPSKQQVTLLYLDVVYKYLAVQLRKHLEEQGQAFERQTSDAIVNNPYNNNNKRKAQPDENTPAVPAQKKLPPSQLIRTSHTTPTGALEPFLVPTTRILSQKQETSSASGRLTPSSQNHQPDCPLLLSSSESTIDLTQPGAFASIASQCACNVQSVTPEILLPRQAIPSRRKVTPTTCNYKSIHQLRKRVTKRAALDVQQQLRSACFVGVLSPYRSLIQCGENLVLLNHYRCAQELFYQLALTQFGGGAAVAKLGEGGYGCVDIQQVIAQAVQFEECLQESDGDATITTDSDLLQVSETIMGLSKQATACLIEKAGMLKDYFSIVVETHTDGRALLTGLPVLLEGYVPSPHGLPMFLLRLATEVDWTEERRCFHAICMELGSYYASLAHDDNLKPQIQHAIFPAVSSLLVPSQRIRDQKSFQSLTTLSKLYKVFERC